LNRLKQEVDSFDKINSDRQKWEEELKAIPIPSGLPQDQLTNWEELRQLTRIQIDEATNPADTLKRLRLLAGVN
ncbi:MAG TPA: hypothetical protein VG099_14015, partial [Gemmataceae bacterium]|nr:hypothetical protein [Gemmataceae bacterium]